MDVHLLMMKIDAMRLSHWAALVCLALLIGSRTATAQAQTQIDLFDTVSGSLDAGGSQSYHFSGQSGEVVSFDLNSNSDGLDASLRVADSSGRTVASNDDRAYPDQLDPLLEAVTLPRTDSYTLSVSAVSGTSGDFTLSMTPGFANTVRVGFGDGGWMTSPDGMRIDATPDRVILTAEGPRLTGFAYEDDLPKVAVFYAQVDVIAISTQSGNWAAGLSFRHDESADAQYLFEVNHQGLWRFIQMAGTAETVIRDWTPHPAIVAGRTTFNLGVLASGDGFDFFYDHIYIGSNTDSALTEAGGVGLVAAANAPLSTRNDVTFANFAVTTSVASADSPVPPNDIFVVNDGRAMVTTLRRMLPINPTGEMRLTLPDSSVQYNRGGVNLLGVGRGATYENFAIGTGVILTADQGGSAGCGLAVRKTQDTTYTLAYFDQRGEYGVSHREGDTFAPGLYGVRSGLGLGTHNLLLIAADHTLYFYIDGHFVGTQEDAPADGEISIAAVNFEPNLTTCHFQDLWVWAWN